MLRALASHIAESQLYPEPWCFHMKAVTIPAWGHFTTPPNECSNLAGNVPTTDGNREDAQDDEGKTNRRPEGADEG
jgi:hypothetical protein